MKTTSVVEWVTEGKPEPEVFKLASIIHDDGPRVSCVGEWRELGWWSDIGTPLEHSGWKVEAWADLPRFEPVKEPIQPRQPSPKPS